ncbi:hypothetical protein M427DRAFT_380754 [Gonapodya prolifera JEL478]|uniref:C2H2-type domain-containing protein n=1 Tax=Gonapodya prolifera (strain JEL478) TaxID=1344416 RepID=A0A139AVB5_GONPJ|nr:hypothetical protein M427DRAFT_380754 [Gonapodya prolifera JEL478]|eukprot:KXS20672.1 hypothetical protein M427DRAFT_380754 [Gonapodya prolifera JEL478]
MFWMRAKLISSHATYPSGMANDAQSAVAVGSGTPCGWTNCSQRIEAAEALHRHLAEAHLNDTTMICKWRTCSKYTESSPAPSKAALMRHVRLHEQQIKSTPSNKPLGHIYQHSSSLSQSAPSHGGVQSVPSHLELLGIPLTASVLLRNLATAQQNHAVLMQYEDELTVLAGHPRLEKTVGTILSELRPMKFV